MFLIDNFLNKITMYRLVLYFLSALVAAALVFSLFGLLPFAWYSLFYEAIIVLTISWVSNSLFAWAFAVPANVESVYITALILILIISPVKTFTPAYYFFLLWASVLAMASKYMVVINKKHIFNPAAFAVALTAITLNQPATWWVGTLWMLPLVAIGGFLVIKKIRRWDLVLNFSVIAMATIIISGLSKNTNPLVSIQKTLVDTPLVFFASIMLTEPLTTPPTKALQIWYGCIVGLFCGAISTNLHLGGTYSTPELALLVGNVFSYIVSPKEKLLLVLEQKLAVAKDTFNFLFPLQKKLAFQPGQYLEWTLGHKNPDSRGNRRYFTIASSPTEKKLMMGVRFYPEASSYKKALLSLKPGDKIIAGQLTGDFTMPKDPNKKLVFVAGGIGITPFRSMIKYLLDTAQKRDIVILYANPGPEDIAYKDIFDQALSQLQIPTSYILTNKQKIPANWKGDIGYLDDQKIATHVPDFKDRLFYISGPQAMVTTIDEVLTSMGVAESHIKKDFFPGFA